MTEKENNSITINSLVKTKDQEKKEAEKEEIDRVTSNLKNLLKNAKDLGLDESDKPKEADKANLLVQEEFHVFRNALWGALKNFPKWERNGLVVIIKNNLVEFDSNITLGRYVPSIRLKKYQEAQCNLEIINSSLELAMRQNYIGKKFYRYISVYSSILGKMLTNLIKNSAKRK